MKKVFRFLAGVIITPIIAAYAFLGIYFNAGSFDRNQMEGVVKEIRRQQLIPNEETQFHFADFSNPQALQIVQRTASGPRNVWAVRTETGLLKVSIMTRDRGHFGEYGFAYSDSPQNPVKEDDEEYLHVPGLMRSPGKKIDAHWWKVVNRDR